MLIPDSSENYFILFIFLFLIHLSHYFKIVILPTGDILRRCAEGSHGETDLHPQWRHHHLAPSTIPHQIQQDWLPHSQEY